MQIRTLFFTCMFAVAGMAAGLGGWILASAVNDYWLAGRLQQAVDITASLFAVADTLVAERPVVGSALLEETPADQTTQATIANIRRAADRVIAAAEQHMHRASYVEAPDQLATLEKIKPDLAIWRDRTADMLARPKGQRDPGFLEEYLNAMIAIVNTLDPAINVDDFAALRHDGVTMDLVSLNRQFWSIRKASSPRVDMLILAIERQASLSPTQMEQQLLGDGRIKERWAVIDVLWRRLASIPEIAASLGVPLAAARAAFDTHYSMHETLLAAARNGGPYAMAAIDVGRLATKTSRAFNAFRDAALTAARTRVQQNQQEAALRVTVAGGVVLSIMALTIAVLIALRRRIVLPVLALTETINRLAVRDYAVEIPSQTHRDEIGRMASAIETLRQGAIAAAEAKAQITHMARHDSLTGMANRTLLTERMQHAVSLAARGRKCAALSVDLDRFKAINDTYGHAVGDKLLQSVADRLTACVRDTDTVSRIGGDEFLVLLADLEHSDGAATLARRMMRALSEPYTLDGHTLSVGVSVGVAVAPQDANTAAALLRCANTALDRAKQDDPGSYRFFEPGMDARLQSRLTLERDLRDAVQTYGFEVFYQPQYNLAENRLCGFEALLRWRHPERGMIGPDEFIPIAEDTGLIVPIGAWVMRQACAEAMNWPDKIKVAVNLSSVQFRNNTLSETVRRALEESGLSASRLDLEITESLLLGDSAMILATLEQLKDIGVSISMDDFGTGYSSLSYLRSFPFDKIKIDKSFVRDLSDRDDTQAIIRAVVAMGKSLGMTTTAEGVETSDQLERLRLEGCTEGQGYLFGKPTTAEATRQLANGHRALATALV